MTEAKRIEPVPIETRRASLSDTDHWSTPQWLFDRLNNIFHFDLDAAADARTAKCSNYLGLDNGRDALVVPWQDYGSRIFINPPYSAGAGPLYKWVSIMQRTAVDYRRLVCAILPATPSAKWYYERVVGQAIKMPTKTRVKFVPPPGHEVNPETGKKRDGARHDTQIVVWLEDFVDWVIID